MIIGNDTAFADRLPTLFPAYSAAKDFFKYPAGAMVPLLRNGSLQGVYEHIRPRSPRLSFTEACGVV